MESIIKNTVFELNQQRIIFKLWRITSPKAWTLDPTLATGGASPGKYCLDSWSPQTAVLGLKGIMTPHFQETSPYPGSRTGLLCDWVVQTDTWTLALASAAALTVSLFPAALVNIWETMPKSQKKFRYLWFLTCPRGRSKTWQDLGYSDISTTTTLCCCSLTPTELHQHLSNVLQAKGPSFYLVFTGHVSSISIKQN